MDLPDVRVKSPNIASDDVNYPGIGSTSGGVQAFAWSSMRTARLRNAIDIALKLREAGNQAFRAGDYQLSTHIYGDASFNIVQLKGLRHLGAIPSDDLDFVQTITDMEFRVYSNEAASWLKYESYTPADGEVSRFRKALTRTERALEAFENHPTGWEPSHGEMAKLFYRRALAYDGLEDYDAALKELQKAYQLAPADVMIFSLQRKINSVR